jgi:hypothetical protein
MEPIATRLKSFMEYKGLSTTAFSRILRYKSCEKIARLFRANGAKPSVDIVADIARHFPELNIRWLVCGQGEMLHGVQREPSADSLLDYSVPRYQRRAEVEA